LQKKSETEEMRWQHWIEVLFPKFRCACFQLYEEFSVTWSDRRLISFSLLTWSKQSCRLPVRVLVAKIGCQYRNVEFGGDGTMQHSTTAITAESRDGQETSSQKQGDTVETFNLM